MYSASQSKDFTPVYAQIPITLDNPETQHDRSPILMEWLPDVLGSPKLDTDQMEIEHTRFNLTKVIEEIVHIIALKAEEKGLELLVHIDNALPQELIGDPLRIRQILLNLLGNAVKFTQRGQICLCVNAYSNSNRYYPVYITVADSGMGMSAAEIEMAFNRKMQTNARDRHHDDGASLGLSISRHLAHLMQGDITVKSWPGIGSHFVVTLPLRRVSSASRLVSITNPERCAA